MSDAIAEDQGHLPNRARFELILSSICLGIGLFVVPALIYTVGAALLGPYDKDAGLAAFYGNFFADLAEPSGRAWIITLAPLGLVYLLRAVFLGPRSPVSPTAATPQKPPEKQPTPAARVEPRISLD
jgi:hypothetical protein